MKVRAEGRQIVSGASPEDRPEARHLATLMIRELRLKPGISVRVKRRAVSRRGKAMRALPYDGARGKVVKNDGPHVYLVRLGAPWSMDVSVDSRDLLVAK